MAITNLYQDKIMGGVRGDPNPFGYQNQINDFVIDNEDYQEIPGFNFKDAPTSLMSRMQNPQFLNNPAVQNPFEKIGSGATSIINKTKNTLGKGFNIGKQGLLSALGFASKLPLGIVGMLPERDPRQNAVDAFYSDPNTRGLMSQIPGMNQYNTVSGGLLNMLTGGKMGEETTYGLSGAIDKRMATIQKTLKKKKSAVLEQRLNDLRELKAREAKALEAAQKSAVYASAERQGFTNDRGGFDTSAADRAGTSEGSGQFSPSTSRGRSGY